MIAITIENNKVNEVQNKKQFHPNSSGWIIKTGYAAHKQHDIKP
jgi:hypothetical protein